MFFEYKRHRGLRSVATDAPTFRVRALNRRSEPSARPVDVSHLIDPSYEYHSPRELRWHLADRFGLKPGAVGLREGA